MLESIVSLFLKEYLKPLEPGQLQLEVLTGTMKLFNIQLLPTALTVRHIPFIIKKGCIKYAKIIFPWNNLKNAACEILIEDLFVALQFESDTIIKSDIQADQKSLHIKSEPNTIPRDEQVRIVQGLFESVIDNLRVQIKNIHLRIEFPCDPKPIVIGIYTPNITFQTVDEKGNVINSIQHPKYVHKQFVIKDFSIYFDTNAELLDIKDESQFQSSSQSIQAFVDSMMAKMKGNHQYIFNPTEFKSVLIHTKDKTQKITNQVQTTIENISLNLDLPQCRSIIHLNYLWTQFNKRRKYANCMRPRSFNNANKTWQYAHKCAVLKNRPHIFKPYLALTILKSRVKYVELFKQAKVSKLSASLLGSPKQKLESLEKKIGRTASIYLREYAEAIFVKEQSMKDSPNVTAFDISQLKSVFESTEFVFSLRQFAASIEIKSFNLELLYEKDSPLISLACDKLTGGFGTVGSVVNMCIRVKNVSVVSFINNMSKNLFQKIPVQESTNDEDDEKNDMIVLSLSIPLNDVITSFDCVVSPIKMTVDTETIGYVLDFLNVQNSKKIDSKRPDVSRFEIGELLQYLKKLNNYKMSVKMSFIQYDFPFKCDDNEVKYLTFEMADFTVNKNIDVVVPKNAPEFPMDFACNLNLKAKIDDFILFTTENINAKINLVIVNGKFGVTINSDVDLSTFQIFLPKKFLSVISFAVSNIVKLPLFQSGIKINAPSPPVLIVGRSKLKFSVSLKALKIFLTDENSDNDMKININDLNGSAEYYLSSYKYSGTLNYFNIVQFDRTFIELPNCVNFSLAHNYDSNCIFVDADISKPHIYLDFKTILWLMNFASQFKNIVPNEKRIQLNEEAEENIPIEITDKNSYNKTSKSVDDVIKEERLKLTRGFTPSSMILNDSILALSIEDFLLGSTSFEKKSLIGNDENDDVQDDDDDGSTPEEQNKEKSINFNLNVTEVCMEMIDKGVEKINSLFTIKSIKIIDFTSNGYKIAFEELYIKRGSRTAFYIPTFAVPINNNTPDQIDIVVDYAESHIYSGDIIALTYDSPTIFQIMFGGSELIFKNKLVVNALCKRGTGSLRYENNDPIIIVHVENPSACISLGPKELNVDANMKVCNGYYKDDNKHFLSLYDNFHAHYIGTMNDQSITIDVPKAKLSLKYLFFDWLMIFEPLTHVDKSTLQPLEIKINVQPCQLELYSDKAKLDPHEFQLIASKTSNLFNYIPDEKCCKLFSFVFGKSKCVAIRDKSLRINLKMDKFYINADKFQNSILGFSNIHLETNERLVKLIIPSMKVNFTVSILAQIINDIHLFIPTDLLPPPSSLNDLFLPNFGIDLKIHNFTLILSPSEKIVLQLKIPLLKLLLNPSHNVAGLYIDAVKVYTASEADKTIMVVNLSQINSIISFVEKNDIDLAKLNFESIEKLPQRQPVSQPLKYLHFAYKMGLIQINYNHFFAKTVIFTVFGILFNIKTLPEIPFISIEMFKKLSIHIDCFIENILINFVIIIDPFASVIFNGVKLRYTDKWEASINNLNLLPIEKENHISKPIIIKKNANEDFLSITIQEGQLFSVLSENEINVDFDLLIYIAKFMMASPILKINPILESMNESKNPNEVIKQMDFATFSKSLPFDLVMHIKKTVICFPIKIDKDINRELQIHISALTSITPTNFMVNLSSLSLNFYDVSSQTALPSLISDFTFDFSIEIEENSSLALKLNMIDLNLFFSPSDLYYIILLSRSIQNALNSQIFAFEETNFDIFKLRINSFELISSNMTYVLCKDTKSYSQVVPIFRCKIPSIMFKVQKSTGKQITKTPVVINVKPYVEYFNIVTGNFDLIIEPTSMHIFAYIIDDQMTFGLNVLDNININFPLNAIINMKDLVDEINENLKKQKKIEYEDVPSMWLCNKLGSRVNYTVSDDIQIVLEHDQFIPLFGIPLNTTISFSIDGNKYTIESNSFNYPTYLSRTILAVKKLYKGGMMISFERTYQIENNLSFAIDLYFYESSSTGFVLITSIEPHQRQPLLFDGEISVSFIQKGKSNTIKHNLMKLYLLDKSSSIFSIIYNDKKNIQCTKTVYNDTSIAARIISISSQYLIYNLLPSTLYFKSDSDEVTSVKRGETTDFYYIENDSILAYLSFDEKKFLNKKSRLKIDLKNTNAIDIFNPDETNEQKCMVEFSYEKEINQTTIIFYMPVVIFNTTLFVLDFEVFNAKTKTKNKDLNVNYKNELKAMPKSHYYWCPHSLIGNSDEDSLMITIFANGNSKKPSQPFDCLTTGSDSIFLQSLSNENLFLPLRCNVSNQSRTSILTLSPLIKMVNNLDYDFFLTPIRDIPNQIEEINFNEKSEVIEKLGSSFEFTKNSEISLPFIPKNGTFAISIKGYITSPSLNLLIPQKTVFKVQNKTDFKLIELQVIDIETGIRVEFNKVVFPTPVLINNQLDVTIEAFQLVHSTPFEVKSHSTSIFAFDEPFIYPSVTLSFGEVNTYHLSLAEDTEKIEMNKKFNGLPVYIQVKHNRNGNRLITVAQQKDEPPEKYKFIFQSSFFGVAASLVDLQMRETALIYLSKLETKFTFNGQYLAVNVTLKSIQVDDQNPLASNPTVIYGYFTDNCPFLSFNCLCPINSNSFTSFDYFAINMQRVDLDIDGSFISDWLNFFTSLHLNSIHPVEPKKPSIENTNGLMALQYFEITPSLFIFRYNRKTKRPPMLGKVPRFLKFIPSISARRMVLPGIFLSRITDRISSIQTGLIDDYKTAAFNSILGMLGSGGKIIKMLGIASSIASAMNIKMTSDLTCKVSLNSFNSNESENDVNKNFQSKFDNQKDDEISSCFSYKSLSSLVKKLDDNSMNTSPLIQFSMPRFSEINDEGLKIVNSKDSKEIIQKKLIVLQKQKNDVIKSSGLRLKIMPGIGYGRGIAGVLTKELNDPLEKVELMSHSKRIRETRPLPGARISVFNEAIANIQNAIFLSGGLNEKVKEISVSNVCDMKNVIVMTENTLYVLGGDLANILQAVKFRDVVKVKFDDEKNEVALKLKDGKTVFVVIESKVSINFLLSMLRMNHRFEESLLL